MNTKTIRTTFLAAFFSLGVNFSFGQLPTQYETATITSDYCVSLDATKPVSEYYKIDISALNFADETEARKAFGYISNNYLSYVVDFDNHSAYLHIHLDRTQNPQDIAWWNNYLNEHCNH